MCWSGPMFLKPRESSRRIQVRKSPVSTTDRIACLSASVSFVQARPLRFRAVQCWSLSREAIGGDGHSGLPLVHRIIMTCGLGPVGSNPSRSATSQLSSGFRTPR